MTAYILVISLPFIIGYYALIQTTKEKKNFIQFFWISYLLFVIFIFGFSLRIGGDWNNYSTLFYLVHGVIAEIDQTWKYTPRVEYTVDYYDAPVLYFFNYIVGLFFTNFIFFKIISSIVFIYSINKFCNLFNDSKYIVFGFFMPYLGIVVSLGYIRQSLAISLFAIAIYYFLSNKEKISLPFMVLSFLSHLVITPFLMLYTKVLLKKIKYLVFLLLITSVIIYLSFDKIQNYFYYYFGDGIHFSSKGAIVRLLLNIPFFCLFIYFILKKKVSNNELFFYILSSVILIFCLYLYFTGRSTLADRLGIQLIFFQGLIIAKIYESLTHELIKKTYVILVFTYSLTLFFAWKELSTFSGDWIPYKNVILTRF